jgi:prepilin-type N-terminal cleavage/methylation domain-containing protein
MEIYQQVTSERRPVTGTGPAGNPVVRHASRANRAGFTLAEIAICLAIIGIGLVAIIGVLPKGLQIQRANREQTVINQDATVLLEAIRSGARGADDLTNYVFMITNTYARVAYSNFTSGAQIVGLLSTPRFVDADGNPIPGPAYANPSFSNRMVAFVYSINGLAVEKPPQANSSLIRQSSFSYGVVCENLPVAHYLPPLWTGQSYNRGDTVAYILNGQATYWQANAATSSSDAPDSSSKWSRQLYPQELDLNSRELRLTFIWPLLADSQPPRVHYGPGYQTFRTAVAGQLALDTNAVAGLRLYFYQPQTFVNAP